MRHKIPTGIAPGGISYARRPREAQGYRQLAGSTASERVLVQGVALSGEHHRAHLAKQQDIKRTTDSPSACLAHHLHGRLVKSLERRAGGDTAPRLGAPHGIGVVQP